MHLPAASSEPSYGCATCNTPSVGGDVVDRNEPGIVVKRVEMVLPSHEQRQPNTVEVPGCVAGDNDHDQHNEPEDKHLPIPSRRWLIGDANRAEVASKITAADQNEPGKDPQQAEEADDQKRNPPTVVHGLTAAGTRHHSCDNWWREYC